MRQPRLNRLPQRLDYTLIPPPLDLSKPLVDEKSPLPAIIVTPSSPSGETDFRIAFLAPEPKPPFSARLGKRLLSLTPKAPTSPLKARAFLLIFLPLFVLACHLLVHRMAAHRPHLHFDMHNQGSGGVLAAGSEADGTASGGAVSGGAFWYDMNDYWSARHARNFVIVDPPATSD